MKRKEFYPKVVQYIPRKKIEVEVADGLTDAGLQRVKDIIERISRENRTEFLQQYLLIIAKLQDYDLKDLQIIQDRLWTNNL